MKKISFVISDKIYLRNFFNSQLIDKLNSNFDINIIINKNLQLDNNIKKNFEIFDYNTSKYQNLIIKYHDIKVTRFKNKSKFFKFRLRRLYRFDLRYLNELLIEKKKK